MNPQRDQFQYAPAVGSLVAHQFVEAEPTEYYDAVAVDPRDSHGDLWSADGSDRTVLPPLPLKPDR